MASAWLGWPDLVYGSAGYLAGRRGRRRSTKRHLAEINAQAIDVDDLNDTQPYPQVTDQTNRPPEPI